MTSTPPSRARRLAILAEGNFGFHHGKTAVGVIRYGPDDVVAVIDSTQAGGNVSSILPDRDIPIVASLAEAMVREPAPDTLLIGIAPTGGKLPDSWRATILEAIRAGLDVHSGLHTFLGDDPEFAAAAAAAGTRIVDYRRPPDRIAARITTRQSSGSRPPVGAIPMSRPFARGRNPSASLRLATIGMSKRPESPSHSRTLRPA